MVRGTRVVAGGGLGGGGGRRVVVRVTFGLAEVGAAERVVGADVVGVGVAVVADVVGACVLTVSVGMFGVSGLNGNMIRLRVSRPSSPVRSVFRQRGV